jgi:hypothetical protein
VVGKLIDKSEYNWGYNAATGEYQDLAKGGVVDPAKVVRTALQDAASVVALLITTEALVAENRKKRLAAPRRRAAWQAWTSNARKPSITQDPASAGFFLQGAAFVREQSLRQYHDKKDGKTA